MGRFKFSSISDGSRPNASAWLANVAQRFESSSGVIRTKVRKPGVAVSRGPALRGQPFAAYPDRHSVAIEALGIEGDIFERVVLAVESAPLLGQRTAQHLELLVGDAPPLGEWRVQCIELLFHPAHADAECEASLRQHVDRRGHFRPVERMTVRQHQHRDTQLHPLGAAGQKCQHRQALQKRPIRRHDERGALRVRIRGINGPGNDDPLGGPQLVEAKAFGELGVLAQCFPGGRATGDREEESELHEGSQAGLDLSLYRCSLPVSVRGSSVTNSIARGYL